MWDRFARLFSSYKEEDAGGLTPDKDDDAARRAASTSEPVPVIEAPAVYPIGTGDSAIEEEEPDNGWAFDTLENHGMDSGLLAACGRQDAR